MKKLISCILSCCLISTIFQGISFSALPTPTPINSYSSLSPVYNLIPSDIGRISYDIYTGGTKTVINIQDIHADENTQKNIALILEYLSENYNIGTIYFEGAFGNLNFDWLKNIKNEKLKKSITDILVKEGKLTGGELFGILNKNKYIKFKGLEEENVYKENFKLLSWMYSNRKSISEKIESISQILDGAKKSVYSYKTRILDMYITDYRNDDISQKQYYSYLVSSAKHIQNLLTDYRSLEEYFDLIKISESFENSKIQKSIIEINKQLAEVLPYKEYSNLVKLQAKYPREYFVKVLQYMKANGIKDNLFEKFTKYLNEYSQFDIAELVKCEDRIIDELYNYYATNTVEKDLAFLDRYTNKLGNFFANNVNFDDYTFIKNNFDTYCILLQNYIANEEITELKRIYNLVNKFYSNNNQRNKTFIEQITGNKILDKDSSVVALKNNDRSPFAKLIKENNDKVDVMITGGYHSAELAKIMENLRINYAVIMPDISKADTVVAEENFYKDYQKQSSVFANTYQKFVRSAIMNATWQDPLNVLMTNFLEKPLLDEIFKVTDGQNAKDVVGAIEQELWKILSAKGLTDSAEIYEIEKTENGSYVITVKFNDTTRFFLISNDATKEIKSKDEAFVDTAEDKQQESVTEKSAMSKSKRFIKVFSRMMTMALLLPLMMVMGGGAVGRVPSTTSKNKSAHNGISGASDDIKIFNAKDSSYSNVTAEKNSHIYLDGKISLKDVVIAEGTNFKITAGNDTIITVESIDTETFGEIDINIEAEGEFKIVAEDGLIKIYKVLRKDFSSSKRVAIELVSVLKKGQVSLYSEADWDVKDKTDVFVLYDNSRSSYTINEELASRTNMLYPGKKVGYVNQDKMFFSFNKKLLESEALKFITENGLSDKVITFDESLIDINGKKYIEQLISFLAKNTAGVNIVRTYIDKETIDNFTGRLSYSKKDYYTDKKDLYLRRDGKFYRYPFRDRNWLRMVMKDIFPDFKTPVLMFLWPVESAKHTYRKLVNGEGNPRSSFDAGDKFRKFMDSAVNYAKNGNNAIVLMPSYLKEELMLYTGNNFNKTRFTDIRYGNVSSDKDLFHLIQYAHLSAEDVQIIEAIKIKGVTIVFYQEGNRGHNEQAYLETLIRSYKYGKESLDRLLTQAGFEWKSNISYFVEGKVTDTDDMESYLKQNPSIKSGSVSYVYDNLKRVFIYLYKNMKVFFKGIIPKYMKGNWISVDTEIYTELDTAKLDEALAAKSKLGFEAVSIIRVAKGVINDDDYNLEVILSSNGQEIKVYSYSTDNGTVYFVETAESNTSWSKSVLGYIKTCMADSENNIVSFNGFPGVSCNEVVDVLDETYVPVVVNTDGTEQSYLEQFGYETVLQPYRPEIAQGLKYPHVAQDMQQIAEAVDIVKSLKRKSFFGQFNGYKKSYVGVKIASDEHIFNDTAEEDEFLRIINASDIDSVSVVIRNNDLDAHVLGRQTTVKENLEKLTENLHKNNKKIIFEYTYRFANEMFDSFVSSVYSEWQNIKFDGIKLDIEDCSAEDVFKIIDGIEEIRNKLPDLTITVQISNANYGIKYRNGAYTCKDRFDELGVTRTFSSKGEMIYNKYEEYDFKNGSDISYEVSMYKDENEYQGRLYRMSAEKLDYSIDKKIQDVLYRAVKQENISQLILPVNMLYAQRLQESPDYFSNSDANISENANVIQAVFNLARLFKETKGMQERKQFAYEFGLQQNIVLSEQQEADIEKILKKETTRTPANYIKEFYPYVFDYFVESKPTRVEISESFLLGIYEANVIRKYKEGAFGKVLKPVVEGYGDNQKLADERERLFYRALTIMYFYRDKNNIYDFTEISDEEKQFFAEPSEDATSGLSTAKEYMEMNDFVSSYSHPYRGAFVFKNGFEMLKKHIKGYTLDGISVYEARLLARALTSAYTVEEIESILPVITQDSIRTEDITKQDDIKGVASLLSAA